MATILEQIQNLGKILFVKPDFPLLTNKKRAIYNNQKKINHIQ